MSNLYKSIKSETKNLLSDPQDAYLISIPCEPGNGDIPTGTVMYRAESGLYKPASSEEISGEVALAILKDGVSTGDAAKSGAVACEAAAYRAGRFLDGSVYYKGKGEVPVADLSNDTVTADKVIAGYTFHNSTGAADEGTMTDNGAVVAALTTKEMQYAIPEGYHDGAGIVSIDSTEQEKIIPGNIKAGIEILGVTGEYSGDGGGGGFTPVGDGNTHLWIEIPEDAPEYQKEFSLCFTCSDDGNTVIDWGDGDSTTTSGTTVNTYSHAYASAGTYHISLITNTGTISLGEDNTTSFVGRCAWNRYRIKSVEIGNKVQTIKKYAFQRFNALKGVYFQHTPAVLEIYIFAECLSLQSVRLPDDMGTIPDGMFQACSSLKEITLPPGLSTIGASAFSGCNLKRIDLPETVTIINNYGIARNPQMEQAPDLSNITSLGDYAFDTCRKIKTIEFPENITAIPMYCCQKNDLLHTVTIPSNITTIKRGAITECNSLEILTIPASVASIEQYAFANNINMKEYHFLGTTPPTLSAAANNSVFSGMPSDCKIYVPQSSVSAYRNAQYWSTISSYIFAEP